MCSIRNSSRDALRCAASRYRVALAALAGLAGFAGCTTNPEPAPEPVSTAILPIDEAIQRRDWPRTAAEFESGNVIAGATRFPYAPQTTGDGASRAVLGPERSNALLDNVFFVGQSIALPFTYFVDPPFVAKEYHGVVYDPTHYAMPVLPPDQVPDRDAYAPPPLKDEDAVEDGDVVERMDREPGAIPPLKDRIEPDPELDVSPNTPVEAQPPTITPEGSEPAPAEPGEPVQTAPDEPAPDATEPAPMPESTEPPPEAPVEPAPESTEPAPETIEPAPEEPAAEPQPDPAPETTDDANK